MKQVCDHYEIRDQWCRHLPKLHGILANASLSSEFPSASHTSDLFDACAFWETLHYLLKHLLGWENPGLGLVWWYAHGQPIHDSKLLSLVSEIWGRDQALDVYAAWAWSTTDTTTDIRPDDSAFPNEEWWNSFRGRPESSWYNPFYGGYNLLHLGHSDLFLDSERVTGPWEQYHDIVHRRAVLIVEHISNWRFALQQAETQLPDIGDRSWHVQVFDRQYGSLGTFRRSRITGRWFQGKHSIHQVGNALQASRGST